MLKVSLFLWEISNAVGNTATALYVKIQAAFYCTLIKWFLNMTTPIFFQDAKDLLTKQGFAVSNTWYHGTSSALIDSIKEHGLKRSGDQVLKAAAPSNKPAAYFVLKKQVLQIVYNDYR